jgi:hypothetical protein
LQDYYQPANQFSDMWPLFALLRKSRALTLADKHRLKTAAKAYKKFGPKLKITDRLKSFFATGYRAKNSKN